MKISNRFSKFNTKTQRFLLAFFLFASMFFLVVNYLSRDSLDTESIEELNFSFDELFPEELKDETNTLINTETDQAVPEDQVERDLLRLEELLDKPEKTPKDIQEIKILSERLEAFIN